MTNAKQKWVLLSFVLVLVFAPISSVFAQEDHFTEEELKRFYQLQEIYWLLKNYHLSSPDSDELIDSAIYGMIFNLKDPHTGYFTEEKLDEFLKGIDGTLVGIGIMINQNEEGEVYIVDVFPGGPAHQAGVQAGDVITHIDGKELEFTYDEEVSSLIRGEEGTSIELTVRRVENGQNAAKKIKVTRQVIEFPLVETDVINDKIGVLKLYSFGNEMEDLVAEALISFKAQGIKGVIIDLRGNPGGYVGTVHEIAALLKDSGVFYQTRNYDNERIVYEIEDGQNLNLPLVVLINGESASGSEVLSGFVQDHKLGVIMGTKSFGKGTVQNLVPIESGGALKLTVEEYYTPSGKQVNGVGITPDVNVENPHQQLAKAYEHLTGETSLIINDTSIVWNGVSAEDRGAYTISRNGKTYIQTRVLADWFGAELSWNAQTQSIVFTLDGKKSEMKRNHESIHLGKGSSYINVSKIGDLLPLKGEKTADGWVIQK